MKIQLDPQLNKQLRSAINKINNFSFNKTAEFQFPSPKKGIKREENAFNCICAALDRIDDLIEHCNALELSQTKEGTFALCDLLNYGQTLIDCITIVGNVYNVKYNSQDDTSSFHQKGATGKGNDEKYFKYLRSLCSIHPLATNAHSEYQGDQPEWCSYINIGSSPAIRLLSGRKKSLNKADFVATIYRNDMEFNKYIPIQIKQIFHYLKKRYAFIDELIKSINDYNNNQIKQLKEHHILLPYECKNCDHYLKNLEEEIHIRCGKSEYEARTWRAIFKTHFEDSMSEKLLSDYKAEMQQGIEKIHKGLQNMDCINDDWSFDVVDESIIEELKGYHYEDEKMVYLVPSYALEDRKNEDFTFINEKFDIDTTRICEMLSTMDKALEAGIDHEKLKWCGRALDNKYKVTNSEWARIKTKNYGTYFGQTYKV